MLDVGCKRVREATKKGCSKLKERTRPTSSGRSHDRKGPMHGKTERFGIDWTAMILVYQLTPSEHNSFLAAL